MECTNLRLFSCYFITAYFVLAYSENSVQYKFVIIIDSLLTYTLAYIYLHTSFIVYTQQPYTNSHILTLSYKHSYLHAYIFHGLNFYMQSYRHAIRLLSFNVKTNIYKILSLMLWNLKQVLLISLVETLVNVPVSTLHQINHLYHVAFVHYKLFNYG